MRVKMLKIDAGPNGTRLPGQVVDIEDAEAEDMIADGAAEALDASGEVETAAGKAQRGKKSK